VIHHWRDLKNKILFILNAVFYTFSKFFLSHFPVSKKILIFFAAFNFLAFVLNLVFEELSLLIMVQNIFISFVVLFSAYFYFLKKFSKIFAFRFIKKNVNMVIVSNYLLKLLFLNF